MDYEWTTLSERVTSVCVCVRCVLCELKADSSTGNRTRAFHVTGGDTHHYTIEEHVVVTTITTLKTKPNSTPNSNYQQPIDVNAHTHTHTHYPSYTTDNNN